MLLCEIGREHEVFTRRRRDLRQQCRSEKGLQNDHFNRVLDIGKLRITPIILYSVGKRCRKQSHKVDVEL